MEKLNVSWTSRYNWCINYLSAEHLDITDGTRCQWNTSIQLIRTPGYNWWNNSVSAEHLDTTDRTPGYNWWNNSVSAEHFDTTNRTPGYNWWNNAVSGSPRYTWSNTWAQLMEKNLSAERHDTTHRDTADGKTLCQRNTSMQLVEHLGTLVKYLDTTDGTPRYNWWNTSIQLMEHLDTTRRHWRNALIQLVDHLDKAVETPRYNWSNTSILLDVINGTRCNSISLGKAFT